MPELKNFIRIPIYLNRDYEKGNIIKRVKWLSEITGSPLKHILAFSESPVKFKGNIENPIGTTQIPLGLCGPIKVNGRYAKGYFLIPLATTEGVLATSYHKGMIVLSRSGGVTTKILKDEIHISPVFIIDSTRGRNKFCAWVKNNFKKIKKQAERTTNHGKLLNIEIKTFNNLIIVKFTYFTGDAMGLNMINKATYAAISYISKQTNEKIFFMRSNFSSDKKPSMENIKRGYGKSVLATAVVKKEYLQLLQSTPKKIYEYYRIIKKVSRECGMIGMNGQFANGLAALFIACGQDVASLLNSAIGFSSCSITKKGDLKISTYLPNLVVGTVGGGTGLCTQKECLSILGCYGENGSKKFAEIIAATVLAGEISIAASITANTYVQAHERLGRNKP